MVVTGDKYLDSFGVWQDFPQNVCFRADLLSTHFPVFQDVAGRSYVVVEGYDMYAILWSN